MSQSPNIRILRSRKQEILGDYKIRFDHVIDGTSTIFAGSNFKAMDLIREKLGRFPFVKAELFFKRPKQKNFRSVGLFMIEIKGGKSFLKELPHGVQVELIQLLKKKMDMINKLMIEVGDIPSNYSFKNIVDKDRVRRASDKLNDANALLGDVWRRTKEKQILL